MLTTFAVIYHMFGNNVLELDIADARFRHDVLKARAKDNKVRRDKTRKKGSVVFYWKPSMSASLQFESKSIRNAIDVYNWHLGHDDQITVLRFCNCV